MEGSSVKNIYKKRTLKLQKMSLIFLFFLVSSCASSPYSKDTLDGIASLKTYCEKDSGLTVYETISVKGYYDDESYCHHCWKKLIAEPFEYYEVCIDDDKKSSLSLFKERGCYRLSRVKRSTSQSDKQCNERIDNHANKFTAEPYISFIKEYCVNTEKITAAEAEVGVYLDSVETVQQERYFDITRYETVMKSPQYNHVYGKYVSYRLRVNKVGGATYSCNIEEITGIPQQGKPRSFYEAVLSKVINYKN